MKSSRAITALFLLMVRLEQAKHTQWKEGERKQRFVLVLMHELINSGHIILFFVLPYFYSCLNLSDMHAEWGVSK